MCRQPSQEVTLLTLTTFPPTGENHSVQQWCVATLRDCLASKERHFALAAPADTRQPVAILNGRRNAEASLSPRSEHQ